MAQPSNAIIISRRATSVLLKAIPASVEHFDAVIYAVVPRSEHAKLDGPWGDDVRLEPCEFNWADKSITITIPKSVNPGITGPKDLDPDFFESVQAAILNLILCVVG